MSAPDADPAASPFLAAVGARERSWWRVLAVVVGGGALAGLAMLFVSGVALLASAIVFADELGGDVGAALETLMEARQDRPLATYLAELSTIGIGFGVALAVFLLVASRLYGRPIRSFLTAAPRFRWRAVAAGFAVTAPLILAVIGLEGLRNPQDEVAPLFRAETVGVKLAYAAGAAAFLFIAAFAEEAVFRGWGLQQARAFTRRTSVILLVSGVLFSLAHADPNLDAFFARAAMGVAWGWIVLRTDGLEFATGAHMANNLMISFFLMPITFEPPAERAFDFIGLGLELVMLVSLIFVVEQARRRPSFGRLLGVAS